MVIAVDEKKSNVVFNDEFHLRKTHDFIKRWQYGRMTEQELIFSLVKIGYDREIITDILEDD